MELSSCACHQEAQRLLIIFKAGKCKPARLEMTALKLLTNLNSMACLLIALALPVAQPELLNNLLLTMAEKVLVEVLLTVLQNHGLNQGVEGLRAVAQPLV
jgi:hypothetical protein